MRGLRRSSMVVALAMALAAPGRVPPVTAQDGGVPVPGGPCQADPTQWCYPTFSRGGADWWDGGEGLSWLSGADLATPTPPVEGGGGIQVESDVPFTPGSERLAFSAPGPSSAFTCASACPIWRLTVLDPSGAAPTRVLALGGGPGGPVLIAVDVGGDSAAAAVMVSDGRVEGMLEVPASATEFAITNDAHEGARATGPFPIAGQGPPPAIAVGVRFEADPAEVYAHLGDTVTVLVMADPVEQLPVGQPTIGQVYLTPDHMSPPLPATARNLPVSGAGRVPVAELQADCRDAGGYVLSAHVLDPRAVVHAQVWCSAFPPEIRTALGDAGICPGEACDALFRQGHRDPIGDSRLEDGTAGDGMDITSYATVRLGLPAAVLRSLSSTGCARDVRDVMTGPARVCATRRPKGDPVDATVIVLGFAQPIIGVPGVFAVNVRTDRKTGNDHRPAKSRPFEMRAGADTTLELSATPRGEPVVASVDPDDPARRKPAGATLIQGERFLIWIITDKGIEYLPVVATLESGGRVSVDAPGDGSAQGARVADGYLVPTSESRDRP